MWAPRFTKVKVGPLSGKAGQTGAAAGRARWRTRQRPLSARTDETPGAARNLYRRSTGRFV